MSLEVAIIDYEMGNLFSVEQACRFVGLKAEITHDKSKIANAKAMILPGVGAFADAMENLKKRDLIDIMGQHIEGQKPFLGICLGMQLLMSESHEFGRTKGLEIIEGDVVRLDNPPEGSKKVLKVPQVGWNQIKKIPRNRNGKNILHDILEEDYLYFVHSFYVRPKNPDVVCATTRYGQIEFCSSLQKDNVFACQFHPERSGWAGLKIYRNFASIVRGE